MRKTGWRRFFEGMRLLQRLRKVDLFEGPKQTWAQDGSRVSNSQEVGRAVVRSPPPPRLSDSAPEQKPVHAVGGLLSMNMKSIFDVIARKEAETLTLKKEIYILREAARMCKEPTDEAIEKFNKVLESDKPVKPVTEVAEDKAIPGKVWP
jgi:hypothetical protein